MNPSAGEDFVTRLPRVRSIKQNLHGAKSRDKLGLNPPTSYSIEQQNERMAYRSTNGFANNS